MPTYIPAQVCDLTGVVLYTGVTTSAAAAALASVRVAIATPLISVISLELRTESPSVNWKRSREFRSILLAEHAKVPLKTNALGMLRDFSSGCCLQDTKRNAGAYWVRLPL